MFSSKIIWLCQLGNQVDKTKLSYYCNLSYDPYGPARNFLGKPREKVPYEGRTRRSDRAGKTRTALLEMRTALLETATAKSMRVNDKNNFVAAKVCSLQNES